MEYAGCLRSWRKVPAGAKKGQSRIALFRGSKCVFFKTQGAKLEARTDMTWTTPVITEVCIGMEVTSYLSAEI